MNSIVGREAKRTFSTRSEFIRDALQYYLLISGVNGFYEPTKAELRSIDQVLKAPRKDFYPLDHVFNESDAQSPQKSKTANQKNQHQRSHVVAA